MNPQYKPIFILLLFIGTILTILGIGLIYKAQSNTTGLLLLAAGFLVHFINLILYYKTKKLS